MFAPNRYGLPKTIPDDLIAAYLCEQKADPANAWMILPVNRLAETTKNQIIQENGSCIPSRITTIPEFAKTVSAAVYPNIRILSSIEQTLIFSEIIGKNQRMLNIFPEKKTGLAAVENLVTLYNTLRYRRAQLPKGNEKLAAIASVFEEYETFLKQKLAADAVRTLELAADAVRDGKFSIKYAVLFGHYAPKELETDLLNAVKACAQNGVEFVPHAENTKIFPVRKNLEESEHHEFAETVFQKLSLSPNLPIKKIGVFSSRSAELSAIAEEICRLMETGVSPGDIAILTPEVPLYAELAGELFPDFSAGGSTLKFESSIGYPLFRSPAVAAVFSLLKTVIGNYQTEEMTTLFSYPHFFWKENTISSRDLLWLSQAAEITGGKHQWLTYPEKLKSRLNRKMEDFDTPAPEKAELAAKAAKIDAIKEKLERIFALLAPLNDGKKTAEEYIEELRKVLAQLEFPGKERNEAETNASAVKSFEEVLLSIDYAETLIRSEKISAGKFYSMLFSFVKSAQTTPSSPAESEECVKIYGFRETVHQKIPHVFLAGLTADVLPRVHPRLPFLTMAETLEAKTQTYEETLREERYAFLSALLTAEKSLYLSAPTTDEGKAKIPSAWLKMFDLPDAAWETKELRHSNAWLSMHAGKLMAENSWETDLDTSRLPDLIDAARRTGVEVVSRAGAPTTEYDAVFSDDQFTDRYRSSVCFSVTELERYAACPFRWYTELHLRLAAHPDPKGDDTPELGVVIHKTMYRMIAESQFFPPTKETRESATADLMRIAAEEFDQAGLATPRWQSLKDRYIGTPRYPGRLVEVIDREIDAANSGYLTPKEMLEFSFSMEDGPGIPLPNGDELRLEGRVDRIGVRGSEFVVTDYKTGKVKTAGDIKTGKSLQLPLYLAAIRHLRPDLRQAGGSYYQISAKSVLETYPLKDSGDYYVSLALEFAAAYRNGMQRGVCAPVYNKTECSFCKERFICRFTELRSLGGGEE
ncbi:PD-(D/E)XK nuclease family protein [Methanorbis furvi]|uniref:ATP-dependent helicase/deoxyribonuclease subunit B n=1 Tax=Methanorbis furvi TaxID=3028299 RepID=A0AAE4MC17_9EURY|nr:ATP-dependent helicase/deoxyribonuclease subunit B [Methanocorpusculaceae archaeon Ag1]